MVTDFLNIVSIIVFGTLTVLMFYRYSKASKKIMIQDKQWNIYRGLFVGLGVVSIINLFSGVDTILDYGRIITTITCVSAMVAARDGVGEEGIASNGKFYNWSEVMQYDYEDTKNAFTTYFMIKSQDPKKPDNYNTKVIDFDKKNKDVVVEFLKINQGRKKTRMKKRSLTDAK